MRDYISFLGDPIVLQRCFSPRIWNLIQFLTLSHCQPLLPNSSSVLDDQSRSIYFYFLTLRMRKHEYIKTSDATLISETLRVQIHYRAHERFVALAWNAPELQRNGIPVDIDYECYDCYYLLAHHKCKHWTVKLKRWILKRIIIEFIKKLKDKVLNSSNSPKCPQIWAEQSVKTLKGPNTELENPRKQSVNASKRECSVRGWHHAMR